MPGLDHMILSSYHPIAYWASNKYLLGNIYVVLEVCYVHYLHLAQVLGL